MRKRIAIAGAVIGTTAGITIGRDGSVVADLGRRSAARRRSRCPATSSSRARPPSRPGGSPSTHRPRPSGRGSCRWASIAAAGTATTSSTCAAGAPTGSCPSWQARRGRRHRSRPRRTAASPSAMVEPQRALVLYRDTEVVRDEAATAATPERLPSRPARPVPAGLAASGAFLGTTPPDFAASWAFVLEPLDGGRTRLIERFRVRFEVAGPAFRVIAPIMGFGVFVMIQRQMLRHQRAGRADGRRAAGRSGRPPVATAAPANGERRTRRSGRRSRSVATARAGLTVRRRSTGPGRAASGSMP